MRWRWRPPMRLAKDLLGVPRTYYNLRSWPITCNYVVGHWSRQRLAVSFQAAQRGRGAMCKRQAAQGLTSADAYHSNCVSNAYSQSHLSDPRRFLYRAGSARSAARRPPRNALSETAGQAGGISNKIAAAFSIMCCLFCLLFRCFLISLSLSPAVFCLFASLCQSVSVCLSLSLSSLSVCLCVCLSSHWLYVSSFPLSQVSPYSLNFFCFSTSIFQAIFFSYRRHIGEDDDGCGDDDHDGDRLLYTYYHEIQPPFSSSAL